MSASRRARVSLLFEQALEHPSDVRRRWLEQNCDDAAMVAEIETLLHAYDSDPGFLETPVDAAGLGTALSQVAPGMSLGPYRLERLIGRGGMGVVYAARRHGDDVDQRVAVKVLRAWSAPSLVERFRFERRVLAGLDHPGIARFLDTGTTADGQPYFVMELVDGQPIDLWCREQRLTLRERVTLFTHVCDAVAHAHQHLVIHRDIKPSNILVTAAGAPKLLDFGIATLLSADEGLSAAHTQTGARSLTLEFASPEQVRGEPVSTASDVYALGVLLYRLLADRKPYTVAGLPPLEAMRVVCDVDPPLMSAVAEDAWRGRLRGDLDLVVAKALRKPVGERYGTAVALAGDLEAWTAGRPVTAMPATWAYRTRRFVTRNAVVVGAAAAVALAIAGGGAATAWQAGVARQERDKAQNRFNQLQQFSRSMLFEVHDALRTLPGATEPRRLLLHRATELLDGLAADADGDHGLEMELAEGFRRLGHVQGGVDSENVGDRAAARASFEKAVRLADGLVAHQPGRVEFLALSLSAYYDLWTVLSRLGLSERAAAEARHAERLRALEPLQGSDARALEAVAGGYVDLGVMHESRSDHAAARAALETALGRLDAVPADRRTSATAEQRALALKRLGAVLQQQGQLEASEQRYREALALDEAAFTARAGEAAAAYSLTTTLSNLGAVLFRQGHVDEGVALWTRALELRRAALDADPRDVRAADSLAALLGRFSTTAYENKDFAASVVYNREKVRLREAIVQREGASPRTLTDRALARLELAMALVAQMDVEPRATVRAGLENEARAMVRTADPADYTAPTSLSGVSVAAFRAARASLATRLGAR